MPVVTSYPQLHFFGWLHRFNVLAHVPTETKDTRKDASKDTYKDAPKDTYKDAHLMVVYDYPQYLAAPHGADTANCVLYYPTPEEEQISYERILHIQHTNTLFPLLSRAETVPAVVYA